MTTLFIEEEKMVSSYKPLMKYNIPSKGGSEFLRSYRNVRNPKINSGNYSDDLYKNIIVKRWKQNKNRELEKKIFELVSIRKNIPFDILKNILQFL